MHGMNENTVATKDNVILRNAEDHTEEVWRGNIKVPDSYYQNERVGKGVVTSVGGEVESVLNVGDVVYYDLHAIVGDDFHFRGTTEPNEYVILKEDAILYKVTDE